ncbi:MULTISPECIES: SIR2 family NAD-dependent protein deacylase [Enorma]|uniref:SIR2 family NAD-dependent protein deacylase n=1 Tax=Enorma TaxID=1472762 RepID=UPI001E5C0093|nr:MULTISPECIES: Sir2 silent information regulator family NAD-dependent deacetylase [Enorma]
MFSSTLMSASTRNSSAELDKLAVAIEEADAIVLGAGSGLSTAAGFTYGGERFRRYFADFERAHGFHDMYSGGFFPFATEEERWAYWSRFIWVNRYTDPPSPVYDELLALLRGRDYFVLTTNVDHCFQKAGIDRSRLFYTQGDYGLWQCSEPCHREVYDNEATVRAMVEAQGFTVSANGALMPPADGEPAMRVPAELVPRCPVCGKPLAMNLRADDTFVEDEGWHRAAARYRDFLRRHERTRVLFWEIGVGGNTPGIIKLPFWRMTAANPRATYACLNLGEALAPSGIAEQSILIDASAADALHWLAR